MGAASFIETIKVSKNTSDQEAFQRAKDSAAYENGHGGYTGTLAEKNSFIMMHRARNAENASRIVESLLGNWGDVIPLYRPEVQKFVDDKWGPAGAVRHPLDDETDGVIFFGYASC